MNTMSPWKILTMWAALLSGSWIAMIGILWAFGLKGLLMVACLTVAILLLVWCWRAAIREEDRMDAQARENDSKIRARINRTQVSNGKRGTAA